MKRWMWGLLTLLAVLGSLSVFGGLWLAIDHTRHYINANPVRRDGADAFGRMVGYLAGTLVASLAIIRTIWSLTRSFWQAYQPRLPRRSRTIRLHQPS